MQNGDRIIVKTPLDKPDEIGMYYKKFGGKKRGMKSNESSISKVSKWC